MKEYNHSKIEPKWQKLWDKKKQYNAKESDKPKFYALMELPYPSGDGLHTGHVRGYTAMDIVARKRRMEGYEVLYPIGWDAFGLPTENYAIKTGKQPALITKQNTNNFRKQFKSLGMSFDWSREVNTTDPKYYKWTQWIFLQFFKKGLAYKARIAINWCPKDKIGLANEEVVAGCCERCGTPVEKREKEQWMLGITKYAERLDKDLDTVDFLPQIKLAQRNWIGKSEGAEIEFSLVGKSEKIKVFTTRPDTIFGATFLAVAPEVAKKLTGKDFGIKTDTDRENKEKIGKDTRLKAKNPANGEEIPIYAVNYVSAEYGTGAIMGVPAHDERDYEFAKKYNLTIKEVVEPLVVQGKGEDGVKENLPFKHRNAVVSVVKHWSEDKYLCLQWKKVDWHGFVIGGIEEGEDPITSGIREIREETGYKNAKFVKNLGGIINSQFYHTLKKENRWAHFKGLYYELVDGEHEEISEEEKAIHNVHWLNSSEVSAFLNADDMRILWSRFIKSDFVYSGQGMLINSGQFNGMESEKARKEIIKFVGGKERTSFKLRDWVFSRQRYWGEPIPIINCAKCGYVPVPEKDLPVKLPSVKNYQPTDSGESPLANIGGWVNVKCPNCKGPAKRETDTMPNWAGSSWYFLRYVDPKNSKAFASVKNLKHWTPVDWYNGGFEHTTLHLLYSRFWHKFLFDQGLVPTSEPYMKRTSHGIILAENGEKMSKSRGNVINPDVVVKKFGSDTLRLYEMFMGPFDQSVAWSTDGIVGPRRFLEKVWKMGDSLKENFTDGRFRPKDGGMSKNSPLVKALHKTIKKVSEDIESMSFNTAISALMILATEMQNAPAVQAKDFKIFLQLLAPFAPHISEELWSELGEKKSIHLAVWPKWDEGMIVDETVKIIVQVNGKVRSELTASPSASEEDIKTLALADEKVGKHIAGGAVKKVIYVKGRLINIVV